MQSQVSEAVLDRIRKLQRLSRSCNEHEAALAAAKMQELLFAHNLSMEALRDPSEYVETMRQVGPRPWAQRLFSMLCRNNFCEPLHGGGGFMYVVGRRENAAAVNEMFAYLVGEIGRIAITSYREYRRTHVCPEPSRDWGRAFRLGAVEAIGTRLRDQRAQDIDKLSASAPGPDGGVAIVRRLDLELREEVARRHPHLGTHRSRPTWLNSHSGYQAGRAAGERMTLRAGAGHLR
jgi:hypothetical protein